MRRLVCAFVVRKPPKTGFCASRPIYGKCSKVFTCHKRRRQTAQTQVRLLVFSDQHFVNSWPENRTRKVFKILEHLPYFKYSRFFKILNTSYRSKRRRQTAQAQIRLLPKKQSHQGILCILSDKNCVNSSPDNQHFICE